jgi:hypothetical protein
MDGGLDAQTIRLEGRFGSRAVGGRGVIVNCAGPERAGNRIEQACSRQLSSVRARFPRCGVAVLACELAGLPWSAVNLAKLSLHATGKGNARKPEMQTAAKARWGIDLKDDMLTPLGLERMRRMAASLQRLRENVALLCRTRAIAIRKPDVRPAPQSISRASFLRYRIVGASVIRQEGAQ